MDPTAALPPNASVSVLSFEDTPLHQYSGSLALVVDHAFTSEECARLVALAESAPDASWEPAAINVGGGRQQIATDVRDCGRILHDDRDAAAWMFARLKGVLESVGTDLVGTGAVGGAEAKWKRVSGIAASGGAMWRVTRLNERLRFLKYRPGQYFRVHCDGQYRTPDDLERSFVTMQLYLSDSPLVGGATRFWARNMKDYVDVEAVQGRVLIFQHSDLWHSGEDIVSGEKITVRTDFMYERVEGTFY